MGLLLQLESAAHPPPDGTLAAAGRLGASCERAAAAAAATTPTELHLCYECSLEFSDAVVQRQVSRRPADAATTREMQPYRPKPNAPGGGALARAGSRVVVHAGSPSTRSGAHHHHDDHGGGLSRSASDGAAMAALRKNPMGIAPQRGGGGGASKKAATASRPKLAATIGGDAAWADAMAARQEAKRELTKSSDAIKALRMENTQLRLQMDSLKARARAGASGRTPLPPETRASRIREELNRRAA